MGKPNLGALGSHNHFLPLQNNVRTFYVARYTSSTTHPSQPTYMFDALSNKTKKERKEGGKTNQTKNQIKITNAEVICGGITNQKSKKKT